MSTLFLNFESLGNIRGGCESTCDGFDLKEFVEFGIHERKDATVEGTLRRIHHHEIMIDGVLRKGKDELATLEFNALMQDRRRPDWNYPMRAATVEGLRRVFVMLVDVMDSTNWPINAKRSDVITRTLDSYLAGDRSMIQRTMIQATDVSCVEVAAINRDCEEARVEVAEIKREVVCTETDTLCL
jgi:hypothetical protein